MQKIKIQIDDTDLPQLQTDLGVDLPADSGTVGGITKYEVGQENFTLNLGGNSYVFENYQIELEVKNTSPD